MHGSHYSIRACAACQGRLRDKTLLEKCLLCVTGNDNDLERHAVVHLSQKQSFLGLVWPRCQYSIRNYQAFLLERYFQKLSEMFTCYQV